MLQCAMAHTSPSRLVTDDFAVLDLQAVHPDQILEHYGSSRPYQLDDGRI